MPLDPAALSVMHLGLTNLQGLSSRNSEFGESLFYVGRNVHHPTVFERVEYLFPVATFYMFPVRALQSELYGDIGVETQNIWHQTQSSCVSWKLKV
jgi:hypothetical protein